jgi:hypothetical protein
MMFEANEARTLDEEQALEGKRPTAEEAARSNLKELLKAGVVDITHGIPGVYSGEVLLSVAQKARLVIIGYDKKVYMGVNSSADQHEKLLQQIVGNDQPYDVSKVNFATALEFDERTGSEFIDVETEHGTERLYLQRQPGTLKLAGKGFNEQAEDSLGRVLSKLKGTTVSWMRATV